MIPPRGQVGIPGVPHRAEPVVLAGEAEGKLMETGAADHDGIGRFEASYARRGLGWNRRRETAAAGVG